ncbi:hypothetical protein ACFL59_14175, partial [Planctomycetota bacterium]
AEGDPDAAIQRLEGVCNIRSDDEKALTTLGHICRKDLEMPKRAAEYYKKALKANSRFSQALLGRAMLLLGYDRHRAFEAAKQALKLAKDDPDALELAGVITLKSGRRAHARDTFLRLYRKNRERGVRALSLLATEASGPSQWDARLVAFERQALEAGSVNPVRRALFQERVELANRIERFLRRYQAFEEADKIRDLKEFGKAKSFSFLADMLEHYGEEESEKVKRAIEAAFAVAPKQAQLAIQDALTDVPEPTEVSAAAVAIASRLGWRVVIPAALDLFRRAMMPRDVSRLVPPLLQFSGPDVALAFAAKLERGHDSCRDAVCELLTQRPAELAEQAAQSLRELLGMSGALELSDSDRAAIVEALDAGDTEAESSGAGAAEAGSAEYEEVEEHGEVEYEEADEAEPGDEGEPLGEEEEEENPFEALLGDD